MWIDEKFFIIKDKIKDLEKSNFSIIDLGSRDKVLKKFIPDNWVYTGVDKFSEDNDYVLDLNKDFDTIKGNYDFLSALDIVEHLDDPISFIEDCKKRTNKMMFINIPNAAYYSFRLKFLFTGSLTEKFHFSGDSNDDRHRWFTNYDNAINFVNQKLNNDFTINIDKIYKTRNKLRLLYWIEKFLGNFFPNLFCWAILITYKKNA